MSNQAAKDIILGKTLHTLVEKHGLAPAEVAQIRLSHLFLAGKNPSINFTPEGSQETRVITLDMETHRALVNWLVNRPDSVGDFLFPGHGAEAMTPAEIEESMARVEGLPAPSEPAAPGGTKPAVMPEADVPPSPPEPKTESNSRPVRPLSRPETGAPPPGAEAAKAPFAPPPMAPEEETMVGVPKPPPVPPARPVAPPPRPPEPLSPSKAVPVTKQEAPNPLPDADQATASTVQPEAQKQEETQAGGPGTQPDRPETKPEEKEKKQAAPPPKKEPAKVGQPVMTARKDRPTTPPVVMERPLWARYFFPGVVVIALLLCGGCVAGGWFAAQSEPGSQFLASLGWSGGATPGEGEATSEGTEEAVVFESALPTPTLPPTSTPTAAPATNTPPPTDTMTPTPLPTDTPPPATDTPTPTDTLTPTDTPEPEEEEAPAPTDTPTPGLKYPAPTLIEPKNDFAFIYGNTIVLQWNPVDLAPDEQYAVRLVYPYQGQPNYQGSNVKEPQWTVPLDLFGKIDGPENRYEWFVVIERANDDGSATAVSPESEHRTFTWK